MSRSRKNSHELMTCGNPACGRRVLYDGYAASIPKDADPARVHRVLRPDEPARSIMCSCGHWTISYQRPEHMGR